MSKKKIKLTDLEKTLLEKSKNNDRFLASGFGWHLYHKTMYLSGLTAIFFLLAFWGGIQQKEDQFILAGTFFIFLSVSTIVIICYIASRKGPSDQKKLDKWKWKKGKLLMTLKFTCYLLFAFAIILFFSSGKLENPEIGYSVFFFLSSILAYYGTVYHILKNPIKATDGFLTGIGSLGFAGVLVFPVILLIQERELNFFLSLSLLLIGFLLLKIYDQIRKKDFLNPVQYTVIKYIDPEKLFDAFKEKYQEIRNQIKALKIIKKLEDKGEYGIKSALGEILIKKSTSNKKFVLTIIGGVLLFVITSIGEGFWQDLLYEPYIKPFLCNYIEDFCTTKTE